MAAGTIWDVLTKLNTAKNYAEIQPVIADLMEKVSGMNRDNQVLTEKISKLEAEIAKNRDFSAEAAKYRTITEDTGVVTYALRQPENPPENAHRFCPNCFKSAKVRYLQPTQKSEVVSHLRGWFRVHECQDCSGRLIYQRTESYNPNPQTFAEYEPF